MKSWLKRLLIGFLVLVVLVGAGVFYLLSDGGLRRHALPRVSAALDMPVTAEKIQLSISSGVEIESLRVGPPEALLVDAGNVKVGWKLGDLLAGKAALTHLTLADTEITIIEAADGTLNLPAVGGADEDDAAAESAVPIVDLRDLAIRDLLIRYERQGEAPVTAELTVGSLTIPTVANGSPLTANADLALLVKRGGDLVRLDELKIEAKTELSDDLKPGALDLDLAGVVSATSGEIKLDSRRVTLAMKGNLAEPQLVLESLALRQYRGEITEGSVDLAGAWDMVQKTGEATVDAKLPAGGMHAVAARILAGLDLGETAVTYQGEAKLQANTVKANGKARIEALSVASKERDIKAIAPMDVDAEHELSIVDGNISVSKLAIGVDQGGRKIVEVSLLEPLALGGEQPQGALRATISEFDLSVLRPFLPKEGPQLRGGKISGQYELATTEAGRMTLQGRTIADGLSLEDEGLMVPSTRIEQRFQALVVDSDKLTIEAFSLGVRVADAEVVSLAATGAYRMSTGEGELNVTELLLSPQGALAGGAKLPGLVPEEWALPSPLLTLAEGKPLRVATRGGETTLAGELSVGPLAGTFAGTTLTPKKAVRVGVAVEAVYRAVGQKLSIGKLAATVTQAGGGQLVARLKAPTSWQQSAEGEQQLQTEWELVAGQFDLTNWQQLLPPEGVQLQAGQLDGKLGGSLNFRQAPAKDDVLPPAVIVATTAGELKAVGVRLGGKDSALPPTVLDATLSLDGSWDAKAETARLQSAKVVVVDADGNRVEAGLDKATTLNLGKDAKSTIPVAVRADVKKLASFAGLLPKDAVGIDSGSVTVAALATVQYPALATALTADATINNLGLVPVDAKIKPAKLTVKTNLAANWNGKDEVQLKKATANLTDVDGNRVDANLTEATTLYLPPAASPEDATAKTDGAAAKPPAPAKQSKIPFELTASVNALEKFAGLVPVGSPRPTSGTVKLSAKGAVGYPRLGGVVKADLAVTDLGLVVPEPNGPALPKLMVSVSVDGAWEQDVEARLTTASVVIRDARKELIDLEAKLTKPGTFSLKEGATCGKPIAAALALTIADAKKLAALAPAGMLPMKVAGGRLQANADAQVTLPEMNVNADLTVLLNDLVVQPEGASAPLPATSGSVKGKVGYTTEWVSPSIVAALRDAKGSLLNLTVDGKVDPKLEKAGSNLRITSTDTISVDRLMAMIPETETATTKATPKVTPPKTAPAEPGEPGKQNLTVDAKLAKVTYLDMVLADINGKAKIEDGRANLESLTFLANGGPVKMSGTADLSAVTGLPFSETLQAERLALGPLFSSFVPKAGAFMDGELSSLSSQTTGPDVDWDVLKRTLKGDFSGGIQSLRLKPSGKVVTDLVIQAALFKTTGLDWSDFDFGGGTLSGNIGDGQVRDIRLALKGPRIKLIMTGSLSLLDNEPDLRIEIYGGGSLAQKSFINAPVDEEGYAKLNDTIVLRSWDKTRILAQNAAQIARAAGVSGKDAALIGAGSQILEGLFGGKKKQEDQKSGDKPKEQKPRGGGFLNALGQAAIIGLGEGQKEEPKEAPKKEEEPAKEPEPAPKKSGGLDDFLR